MGHRCPAGSRARRGCPAGEAVPLMTAGPASSALLVGAGGARSGMAVQVKVREVVERNSRTSWDGAHALRERVQGLRRVSVISGGEQACGTLMVSY
jgi:hypothetical protein